jgi:LAO/AO transport system kinase
MTPSTLSLFNRMRSGDTQALARLMTYVDNRHEDLLSLMAKVYDVRQAAMRIGITGPPGAGKSTLTDKIISAYRKEGKTVGVIAIDPSSPFSGGAVLGDRIRMQDHNADAGVFIRSLGSRGAHGGLSRATRDIVQLLDAAGYDVILIETVGVGQTELDIMSVAQTTLVVLVPESGDTIQTMKAGLMEIADVFVVNKADRDGADRIFAELNALAELHTAADWVVPVYKAVAVKGTGVDDILAAIVRHQTYLTGRPARFSESLRRQECLDIFSAEIVERTDTRLASGEVYETIGHDLSSGKLNPYAAVAALLQKITFEK